MKKLAPLLLACVFFLHSPLSAGGELPWPLIIAHRGASGTLPEHTLESYALAIEQGAHFIEPDLVSTRDGVLIARHENELSDTTDVATKFPGRQSTRTIDGREVTGWFSEDFTLAEINTLRARERLTFRDQSNNGKFGVPTFDEVLALVRSESAARGRDIGVYPETKHPTYFAENKLPLEPSLLASLSAYDYSSAEDWVFIQSFEVSNLKHLSEETDIRLVQLLGSASESPYDQVVARTGLTYADMIGDEGLRQISEYAIGIGPWKGLIAPQDSEGNPFPATDLIERAHSIGLVVHAYTFRDELRYLIKPYNADPLAEYQRFFALGVDGVFSDFPASALAATP
jgi:glycerophosphoryl diester phosphodiesterase